MASGPYERLAHKPPTAEDLEKGKYLRLSARTAGKLLQAMAETVRAEMVARSITGSPVALLFRLYTMYQPGGESEKAYILQYMVTPPKAQTAVEMVATLRQWERMLLRADNPSIAKPDPSLLVRGLNALVGDVWAKDRDVTFRTQLVKSRLGVDVSPTWESALQLHEHLMAEAENMVHALPTTTKPAVGDGQRDPKLRPLQPNQSQGTTNLAKASSTTPPTTSTARATIGGTGDKKCKWFTEPQGCRRGANCKFVHSFEGISKKNRCYTCGAEGHQSSSCPTKTEGNDSGPKPKGKAKAKSAPGTPSSREDSRPGNPAARSLTTEPEPQPTPPTSPTTTGEATSSAGTGEMKEVLRDAAQALKSLMSSGSTASSSSSTLEGLQRQLDELKLKALSIKNEAAELRRARRTPLDVRVEEGVPTLIDSGATHILRQPRDGAEMASATRVSVTLANDEKRDLLQAESGAILSTSAETQPILPMAELVSAGCEISWKKGNFKVVHPVWGELRTTIRGGCPELAQEQAAKLVKEIEDKKLKELKDGVALLKAKLEHLVHEEKLPWITYVERYLEGGLAKDLWKGLQGSFMKILSEHMLDPLCQGIQLGEGWNHLKDLPLPRRLRKRMLDSTRWVVHLPVSRDEEHPKAEEYGPDAVVVNVPGELLTKAYIPLLWGAATGRIAAIIGSTPATSVASELQTMRMARALALYVVGRLARPTARTGFFWTTPTSSVDGGSCQLLKEFVKVTGMRESELNLGDFGVPGRKPLIATTNYHLDGFKPRSVSEEGTIDQSAVGWPVTLKLKVARAVRENSFEDQHVARGGSLKAMTPEKWKEHVRAGHYPARRDCLQYVMHGATGHRHTRVERVVRYPHTEVLLDHLDAGVVRHPVLLQVAASSQLVDNKAPFSSLQAAAIASSSWLPAAVVLPLEPPTSP